MKLWIFGDSLSLPTNISSGIGWPELLSQRLGCEIENWANEASDNLYIYHCFRSQKSRIASDDIVVIGWTHPSRKTFVYDQNNPAHADILKDSIVYDRCDPIFFRSFNPGPQNLPKWKNLKPCIRNKKFYDDWFRNYYSDYEQRCLLESFYHATKGTISGIYIPWFFSEESISSLDLEGFGTMLEFIQINGYAISAVDSHLNEVGHHAWAEHLFNIISHLEK